MSYTPVAFPEATPGESSFGGPLSGIQRGMAGQAGIAEKIEYREDLGSLLLYRPSQRLMVLQKVRFQIVLVYNILILPHLNFIFCEFCAFLRLYQDYMSTEFLCPKVFAIDQGSAAFTGLCKHI